MPTRVREEDACARWNAMGRGDGSLDAVCSAASRSSEGGSRRLARDEGSVTDETSRTRRKRKQEQERARVEKELANIRRKSSKTHRALTSYERKKYVLKLLYIYMLGYNVDFGHNEALKLISANAYSEKQVGYMTTSVILNEKNEFLRMAINSIRTDVISNNETSQCLGLSCIANVGGREFSDSLAGDVETILMTPTIRPVVRKKAALCLLRLFRKNSEILIPETFAPKLVDLLDSERDLGVLLGVLGLLLGVVQHDYKGYEACVPQVIAVMERLTRNTDIPPEYLYYGIPSPWLQVKCMKILQYFPTPDDPGLLDAQLKAMRNILLGTETVKNFNKNNALHAILFEAINLVTSMDFAHELMDPCVELLGKFLSMKEVNIKYLALNTLNSLAVMPDLRESIKVYENEVVNALHDADISIRKRALSLLFSMCDASNVHSIIDELLNYFGTADFDIREELALKTAILAERYSVNDRMWFIQVALTMIDKAGDFINDDLWHRVVQVATNKPELHQRTAELMLSKLKTDGAPNELVVRLTSYCLGEFGYLLPTPPSEYVALMVPIYHASDVETQAIMLTAFIKIAMHKGCDQPSMAKIVEIFNSTIHVSNVELQQRASEYLSLLRMGPSMRGIFEAMPEYPERESVLERHVQVENAASDVAGGVRKLGLESAKAERPQPSSRRPPQSTSALTVSAPAPPAPPAPRDAVADLLGELAGGSSARAAPALPAAGSDGGLNLDQLLGNAPVALPPAEERLSLPSTAAPSTASALVPAAARQAPASAANLEDLLGMGSVAPVPAPAAPPALATPAPSVPALVPAQSVASSAASGVQPSVNVDECAKRLIVSDNGLLYEDANLQIGIKSQWQGSQGRIMFYVGNKSPTADLQGFKMVMPVIDGLRHQLQPVPDNVGAKRQVQLMMQVAITKAFIEPPTLQIAYTLPGVGTLSRTLELPLRVSKFLTPLTITSPQEFIAKWHQMASASQQQKIMDVSQQYASGGIERVAVALGGMRLGVQNGLDPNPANLVGGSKFVGELCGEVLVGVRIESDANVRGRYRFTVASMDGNASAAVMSGLIRALQ